MKSLWERQAKQTEMEMQWAFEVSRLTFKQFWFLFLSSLLFLAEVSGYSQSSTNLCEFCWFSTQMFRRDRVRNDLGSRSGKHSSWLKKGQWQVNWEARNNFLYARLGYQEEKEDGRMCRTKTTWPELGPRSVHQDYGNLLSCHRGWRKGK